MIKADDFEEHLEKKRTEAENSLYKALITYISNLLSNGKTSIGTYSYYESVLHDNTRILKRINKYLSDYGWIILARKQHNRWDYSYELYKISEITNPLNLSLKVEDYISGNFYYLEDKTGIYETWSPEQLTEMKKQEEAVSDKISSKKSSLIQKIFSLFTREK